MKSLKIDILLFTAALYLFSLSCNKPVTASKITYSKNAVFPDYTKRQINIYHIREDAGLNDSSAQILIKNIFQIAGTDSFDMTKPIRDNNLIWYKNPNDPSAILNINYANEDITLNKGMLSYTNTSASNNLVKGDTAIEIAKKYLEKLQNKSLQEEMTIEHVGGVNMGVHTEDNKNEVYEKFTSVKFGRQLNNIPVIGHSRAYVELAENGSLHSLIVQWTPVVSSKADTGMLIAPDELRKRFEQYVLDENKSATAINISSIDLVYFDDGKSVIEPAIRAKGITAYPRSEDKKITDSFSYDIVVPLLKNPQAIYSYMHDKFQRSNAIKNDDKRDSLPIKRDDDELQNNQ